MTEETLMHLAALAGVLNEIRSYWDEIPLKEGNPTGANQHKRNSNNITVPQKRGTSQSYVRRRLKQQYPALYQKVLDGKLSASAAGIQAGFIHRTVSIIVDAGPEKAVEPLLKHFTGEQLMAAISKFTK